MITMLRKPTRLIMRRSTSRNVLLAMTFLLVLGGLLSPLLPVVEAATISNVNTANRAAAQANDAPVQIDQAQPISVQPLQPVDQPADQPSDDPPPDRDADGNPDERDSCPDNADTGLDWDADGIDDACDPVEIQQEASPATIQVNMYWCQAGTDVVNAADGDSLLPACGEQGNPVQVALVSATNSSPQQNGSANTFPGSVQFNGLAPDSWNLFFQTTDLETQGMFCYGNTSHGNTKPYARYSLALTSNPGYPIDTLDDESIVCDWFGVPAGMTTAEAGFGDLHVMKYACPDAPPAGADLQWFRTNCEDPMNRVQFNMNTPTVNLQADTGDNGTDGSLTFGGVDTGSYQLVEETSTFFQPLAVFCVTVDQQTTPADTDYTPATLTGSSIDVTIATDQVVDCVWFNLFDGHSLTIYKWECLPGTTYGQDADYYGAECATQQADVPFKITDDLGPQDVLSDIDGVQIDGLTGQILIEETIPDGFGFPVVYCHLLNDDDSTLYPSDNGMVTLPAAVDDDYQCNWYNLPEPDGHSLTIYKWECPDGTTYGQAADYYGAECATEQAGVPFDITDDNGTQSTTSDTNGRQIDNLVGEITIQETIPPGFGNPVVFCKLLNDEDATLYPSDGGTVTLPIAIGDDFQCFWYNLPEMEGTSLTIYKFECPPTVVDHLQDLSVYEAECATEQPGVEFTVTDDGGPQTVLSDNNGVQVDGLTGQISIAETIPAGYGLPAVFCQALNDPEPTSQQLGGGNVTLPAITDDDYQCWYYNIPTQTTTVTIYKWECPAGTLYGQANDYYSAECATEQAGVPFQITDSIGTQNTTSDNNGRQIDGLVGEFTITELTPPGFGNPAIFCQLLNDNASTDYSTTSPSVTLPANSTDDYQCWFYNIPEDPGTVEIYKWECPDGSTPEPTVQWHQDNCVTPMNGVEFTLTDSAQVRSMNTAAGMVSFTDIPTGPIQIRETIPVGYSNNPFLVCQFTYADGTGTGQYSPSPINGVYNTSFDQPGSYFRCDWYNYPVGPGEITVYKWTCPEGYDRTAWGADPTVDCTEATNGVTFKLDQPDPGVDLFSDTGDSIPGGVYFGGLEPGDYILTEMLDPAVTMSEVFVWQCTGLNTSSVHPTPLSVGQTLNFKIAGGDKIVCHWFNVPMPQYGWMEVSKFNCTTETYVKDVYCYTNQTGQEFNLQMWVNGTGWVTVQSGITDVSGKLMFSSLEAGAYQLIEPNGKACMMKSSNITSGGFIGVNTGEGTTVYVYNCKTPPPPQKTPGKYPNTGVAPEASSDSVRLPGVELTGLLGLMGLAITRRRMVVGAGLVAAASLPLAKAQDLQPLTADPTVAPGTPAPEVFGCAGTPEAWTQPDGTPDANGTPVVDPCNRGAIPMQMRIPAINVDAPMEYLEIIDGVMQQPTGDTHIAWYKETSRLGEVGNGIYAAHVNWYGNPEGIFFRLESLQKGDVIEIDGDNLETYLFDVQWMQNFPSDEEPPDEALGLTNEKAITLITCGGEWSSALSEYDHRTLVRAVLRE